MSPEQQPRYAVYFAPSADSALWREAQDWLGRDCASGAPLLQPALDGWSAAEISAVTRSPRHYGFHGTLKAPFRLAPGTTLATLRERLGAFAAGETAFHAPPLKVSAIGAFIALTFSAPAPEMQALAAAAVQALDDLRAPLSEAEIARRLQSGLTPRQEALLRRWGYPYVLEEFRFHMTLTGRIEPAERRERLQTQLAALLRPVLAEPVPVREICLYSQADQNQPFLLAERFALGGTAAGQAAAERTTA